MRMVSVMGFNYSELDDKAKARVKNWLDDCPFEYENDEGELVYDYASDWSDDDIDEHCQLNEYLFNKRGEYIHHMIEG